MNHITKDKVEKLNAKLCIGYDPSMTELTELCNAAIQHYLDAQKASGWQPIETAPKDFVTMFDGWNGDRVADVIWGHPDYSQKGYHAWCISEYTNGHGWDNVEVKGLTHWMPLPAAPQGDSNGKN